jgi:Zn-dependent M28 family amino/carboxypeptidase
MLPKDALPITLAADEAEKVPVVHVGEDVITDLFGSVDSLRNLQAAIDRGVKPVSFAIAGAEAFVQTSTEIKDMSADNVVGYLEGWDPVLKNEVIVVGAHYDHVGFRKEHEEGEDYIYNGADDNASGTSAMMAIAAGFGAMNERPRRSVLFIAFAGEEKGLFGSEFYVRHPLFPLEKTVAMFNLDMVGRNSEDSLLIIGAEWSPDLVRINAEENRRIGFVLVNYELNGAGSDHMTFLKKHIPILYYFSGMHADVHKVSDNPELINTRKAARISRLAFLTLWRIANEDRRYQFIAKPVSLF